MHIYKVEHVKFLKKMMEEKNLLYYQTQPFRTSSFYWIINTLNILKDEDELAKMKDEIIKYILECKNEDGGFGGCKGYPSTILNTFHSLQVLYIYKHPVNESETAKFIAKLYQKEGYFFNDQFEEIDTRINCCAILSLKILHLMSINDYNRESLSKPIDSEYLYNLKIDINSVIDYTLKCYNLDGGFGALENAESHSAQVFCCLNILRSLGSIEMVDKQSIARFIIMLQNESGGFSGRLNKKEDACYSFWSYSSLVMLGCEDLANTKKLKEFISMCQNSNGGFSYRPKKESDVFHMNFSLCALSLLKEKNLNFIDPGFGI